MELTPSGIGAACTVIGLVGGGLVRWVDASVKAVKATQKLLFEKHDAAVAETHALRLHVAETYVSRNALKEQLAPIMEGLKEIRDELRQDRKDHRE